MSFFSSHVRLAAGIAMAMAGAVVAAPAALHAQADSPSSEVYTRAQDLVGNGEGAAGRALVDSMLAAARAGTPAYAEALFWRAALAQTAAEAERDYLRVSVEYPASPFAEDALLRLGMLELSRGNRRQAMQRFESLVLRYPTGRQRPRAQYWIGRTYFDDNRIAEGCTALSAARSATPGEAVELITQIDYYAQRCRGVQPAAASDVVGVGAPASTDVSPTPAPAPAPSTPAPVASAPTTPAPSASAPAVTYSVQVAAFPVRANAERYAARLRERGFDARVDGTSEPFRVRIGRYGTREAAMQRLQDLRRQSLDGFVAEVQGQ
jgi:TolA-binding protein